ncbi:hypothetical protein H4F99_12975 [Lysobacter sp. SG-8]|uniref:DUF1232 domain-containing protein n=1 Tax=Marilutibacter penaei TaxID=2759900 RepID=A0A7W3U5P0_9GAMM|nr:YkvA family protein [Lysobacter penaei]MBB1089391.1 hypothetical protein [Lysobacter penaei]
MNAIVHFNDTLPLPTVLDGPTASPHRRHLIDRFDLAPAALARFNAYLNSIDPDAQGLDADRIATAARELNDRSTGTAAPRCITEQMRRATALVCMEADRDWRAANEAGETARKVIAYVRGNDDLIPDGLPRVGRLDDAIVIRTAWPLLADEVADYLDFCRIRRIEAQLRGLAPASFHMDRNDWESAGRAEMALVQHHRRVRECTYLPERAPLFRVH